MKNFAPHKKIIIFFVFCFLFWLVGAHTVRAASLYLSPSSGSYNKGSQISVGVYVSSADQAMNAVGGQVDFPTDKLSVVSVSKSGSILSMWVQDPAFSNTAGTVNFEGIVFNPGYTGKSGKVLTIVFKVKQTGTAKVSFSSGDILANDGNGTSILQGMGSASFNLAGTEKAVPVPVPPPIKPPVKPTTTKPAVESVPVPGMPNVFSSSHPDSEQWYIERNLSLAWGGGKEIIAVRFSLDKELVSLPTEVVSPAIFSKSYENLTDGIYYFNIQLKSGGGWGPVGHYKIQIDATAPEQFIIQFPQGVETDADSPLIKFDLKDLTSGIAGYRVKVDGGLLSEVKVNEADSFVFSLPKQSPGKRTITVEAFDKAGNITSANGEMLIKQIKTPVLVEYPVTVDPGMPLVVVGITYPDSEARVWWRHDGGELESQRVLSDEQGRFVFALTNTKKGAYKIWVEALGGGGRRSSPSAPVTIFVEQPWFLIFGRQISQYLLVVISIVILVLLLDVVIWLGLRSWGRKKK